MSLTESIKKKALESGFDLVGVTSAEPLAPEERAYLESWLQHGCAAGMPWMHRHVDKRTNPAALLAGARSVICTATVYGLPAPEADAAAPTAPHAPAHGRIADYARLDDYHVFLKERLFALADAVARLAGGTRPRLKVCVDSAPLAERSLARRAGLGFIGRNHMLTNERLGSQLLLGEIVTDLPLDPDTPAKNPCGDCTRCVQACPTGALAADGSFDSARCISYLTIEHRGTIDPELTSRIGDRLFGCDECALACPYTQNAPPRRLNVPSPRRPRWIPLHEIMTWRQEEFEMGFSNSPVQRLGLEGLKRSAEICLANAARR